MAKKCKGSESVLQCTGTFPRNIVFAAKRF